MGTEPVSRSTAADREIDKLMALHPKGYDLSLERIETLLARLGNPERRLPPVIHIAGTNGKGSASAFARALLEAAGQTVHVHTSPHLVNWHERYRMAAPGGGVLVDDDALAEAIRRVRYGQCRAIDHRLRDFDRRHVCAVCRAHCRRRNCRGWARRALRRHQCDRETDGHPDPCRSPWITRCIWATGSS